MKVLTIPEFYEKRFDRKTRILGGIMMVLGGILNMGLFLKVGSMFLVGITGLSATSWALPAVMIFLITLVLIYTVLGGMISVVIADYVQFVVLSISLLAITIISISKLGWKDIFDTIESTMGPAGFDPTVAGGGFGWEYIAWMFFLGLVSCAIWPTAVARALSMESASVVKRQYMFTSVSYLIRFLIPYFWGIAAFVFITKDATFSSLFFPGGYPPPDALPPGTEAVDNLYGMPFFLGKILPAGFIGLVTAGMLAAFMSTHDSYLLCWSTSLTQDVVAPIAKSAGRPISSKRKIALSRIFIVLIGGFVLYWGLFYKGSEDVWDYMAVTGAIYFTGAFALLLGGLYWKRASSTGAFIALIGGLGAILGLTPVQDLLGFEMSSARVGLLSILGTLVLMVIGSLLFPDRKKQKEQQTQTNHGN
jgi:SSS family solute:Na+ symporter